MKYTYFLLFLALTITSCSEVDSVPYELIYTGHVEDLESVDVLDSTVYAVGGYVWNLGLLHEYQPSTQRIITTEYNKGLFHVNCNSQECIIGGTDGRLYSSIDQFQLRRYQHWDIHRSSHVAPNGDITAVGGKSFGFGHIMFIPADEANRTVDSLEYELRDIAKSPNGLIAVGFGKILRQEEGQWQIQEEEGDFFVGVDFIEAEGYIIGSKGKLLKSKDGGLTWQGDDNFSGDYHSLSARNGVFVITGSKGRLAYKFKEQSTWTFIKLDGINEINDAVYDQGYIYFVGENGVFGRTEI